MQSNIVQACLGSHTISAFFEVGPKLAMHVLQGWTPVHRAADSLHVELMQMLLKKSPEEALNSADHMVCLCPSLSVMDDACVRIGLPVCNQMVNDA